MYNDTIRQERKVNMSAGKFLAGFALGGVIGAVAGILLAPQSGEETREMISETSKDWTEKAKDSLGELQTKADEIVANLQSKGDELVEKIQDFVNKQKAE